MSNDHNYQWRLYLVLAVLIAALLVLIGRFVFLNVIDRSFLLQQSQARILRTVSIPAYRGMILGRDSSPLAISTPLDSVCVNPKIYHATGRQQFLLAKILGLNIITTRNAIARYKRAHKEFMYLKRLNPPRVAQKVTALKIPGVFLKREFKRYYPESEVTAQVVGLTNIDDQGQEGLELAYNKWLSGKGGKKEVIKDRLGNIIRNVALLRRPVQGKNLYLSIDHRIQYIAYRALKEQVNKYHAASGAVVVLDAKTGEVLAMVNQPSYNPNDRPKIHDGRFRNRAVTDTFEPGSTIKPFTIALALQSGRYTPSSTVNTSPGRLKVGGYTIKDDGLDYGVINLTQVLQKSSNIGAAKIMLSLPPQNYWHLLRTMGFGQRTSSGFPGESPGILRERQVWYPSVVATLAYGYGIAVTTLQLAHAYQILADHGVSMPVTFIKQDKQPKGSAVLNPKVADTVVKMLETVVQSGGTGRRAAIPGYRVAGKTGTAYIAGPHGYNKSKFIASFVGIAPVSNPRLVVAVDIRDPQGQHFGGVVAAPVFAQVMSAALRDLGVSPDRLTTASSN
jgi:cell division protein FtsI (penicillin-binding protein 3)